MRIAVAGSTGLIGRQLTALAKAQGHEVVELARTTGFDLLAPDARLVEALRGATAVVDVTQSPTLDEDEATAFFTTVAENLGRAAGEAGVTRTVVLSIVGVDRMLDYGYYVAKFAQERTIRATAPGTVIVRATQFHDFPGQMLEWNLEGQVTRIPDVPTQPVAAEAIVELLLAAATGEVAGDVDLAGPQAERLVDLVERLIRHRGLDVKVEAVQAPASMAGGSMLPGPGALLRGPDWATWLQTSQ